MHFRFSHLVLFSAAALAFSGCEWGGAHENTWNDGYSWLNFTGTYALSELAALTSSGSTSSEEASSSTSTTVSTANFTSKGTKSGSKSWTGSISLKGTNPTIRSFTVSLIGGKGGTGVGDPETGLITGPSISGSFTTTSWNITYEGNSDSWPDDVTATGTYTYENVVTPGGGGSGGTTISYLHVTQKGNVLTITDSAGTVYNGRTTGSSGPANGYENAGSASMSFEASSSGGGRIVGSLTGVWSGSSDKTHGTLSGRTIHATISTHGSNVDVVGTAPSIVLTVSE